MEILTICIPCFRPSSVDNVKSIHESLRQIDEVKLLVLNDNPTVLSDADFNFLLKDDKADFVRYSGNIGLAGNLMNSFALSKTSWLWIVGDDDEICFDSISLVLETLKTSKCDLLKFNYYIQNASQRNLNDVFSSDKLIGNIGELHDSLDVGELIYTSNTVYNLGAFSDYLKYGFQATSSLVPHLVMILQKFGTADCILQMSKIPIVINDRTGSNLWSRTQLYNDFIQIGKYLYLERSQKKIIEYYTRKYITFRKILIEYCNSLFNSSRNLIDLSILFSVASAKSVHFFLVLKLASWIPLNIQRYFILKSLRYLSSFDKRFNKYYVKYQKYE